jgi:hypothetical protein
MIILDRDGMPVNLGHTTREDYPEGAFPILAYDGQNVLPTALGYRSFFAEHTKFTTGPQLADKKVQQMLVAQTPLMSSIFLALCEDGLYVCNATNEVASFNWLHIVDYSATEQLGVRRLWTYCVISNVIYLYQQGSSEFFGLVDLATYAETTIPEAIVGATITQVWSNTDIGIGLLKYTPNFINMSGQIGLFKAANRLGFWDSEGAVAWSSATQIYDFKPSTTNFAGVTTFADVVGEIVLIKQHGNGFIIYATKSITLVVPLSGSPEKWSGRAIFSDVGVVFDIQVAMGQPDTVHYAITSGGLCVISNGNPEFVEPEVMDYIRKNNILYALSLVDSRYLLIHAANNYTPSVYAKNVGKLKDFDGNGFYAFPEVITTPGTSQWIDAIIVGTDGLPRNSFADYALEPGVTLGSIPGQAILMPCYDISEFDSTWANTTFSPLEQGNIDITSQLASGMQFNVEPYEIDAVVTVNSYSLTSKRIDKAGAEAIEVFNSAIAQYNKHLAYEQAWMDAIHDNLVVVEESVPLPAIYNHIPSGTVLARPEEELRKTRIFDFVRSNRLKVEANECRMRMLVEAKEDLEITYKFSGEERVEGGKQYAFFSSEAITRNLSWSYSGSGGAGVNGTETIIINRPKVYLGWTFSEEDKQAFADYQAQVAPHQDNLPVNAGGYTYTTTTQEAQLLAVWVARFRPQCIIAGSAQSIIDYFETGQSGTMVDGNVAKLKPVSGMLFQQVPGWDEMALGGTGLFWSALPLIKPIGTDINGSNQYVASTNSTSGDWSASYDINDPLAIQAYADIVTLEETYGEWTTAERDAIYAQFGTPDPNARTLKLVGNLWARTELVPPEFGGDVPVTIYDAELSGWGYIPAGGSIFRKTHSRHSSTSCPMPPTVFSRITNPVEGSANPVPTITGPIYNNDIIPNPGYEWEYPPKLPFPDNYVQFQKGTISPYYQIYEHAVVLDTQLEKWGHYSNPHRGVFSLSPINRTDQSILPIQDNGMRAGAVTPENECSFFTGDNPQSTITYGKLGDYRLGVTFGSKIVAQFAEDPSGQLVLESSIDGDVIDLDSSVATDMGSRFVQFPFTRVGKWFSIRLEGAFNLVSLAFESQRKGRR